MPFVPNKDLKKRDAANEKEPDFDLPEHENEVIETRQFMQGNRALSREAIETVKEEGDGGKSIGQKLKAIGGKLSKVAKGRELTEEELDDRIRITHKKAQLAAAKAKLGKARSSNMRRSLGSMGNIMASDLSGPRKRGRGSPDAAAYGFYGMGGGSGGSEMDYGAFLLGNPMGKGKARKGKRSGDPLKDFYGM